MTTRAETDEIINAIVDDAGQRAVVEAIAGMSFSKERLGPIEACRKYLYVKKTARPGRYSTRGFPFQVGMAEAFGDPSNKIVAYMLPTQVAKTTVIIMALFFFSKFEPSDMIFAWPTEKGLESFVGRLREEIKYTPEWAAELAGHGDGISNKGITFRKCHLKFALASSPTDLSETPARVAFADEVRLFPDDVSKEGSPIDLLIGRLRTYPDSRAIFASKPSRHDSQIDRLFHQGDQRLWSVPCLKCGLVHPFEFENVKWPHVPPDREHEEWSELVKSGEVPVWYECPDPDCAHRHTTQREKHEMNDRGEWVAQRPNIKGMATFRLTSLASPNTSFVELAAKFLYARGRQLKGDDSKMQIFYNEELAKSFDPKRIRIEESAIVSRCILDMPNGLVPQWADFVTTGVDVQHNRVYILRSAWQIGTLRRHTFDWKMLMGRMDDPDFRNGAFKTEMERSFAIQGSSKRTISSVSCIDAADGMVTDDVYAFCRGYRDGRMIPIHGGQLRHGEHVQRRNDKKGLESKHRGLLHIVASDGLKDLVSKLHQRDLSDANTPTFAAGAVDDKDFQRQLCSLHRDAKGHWVMRSGYGEDHYKAADTYDAAGAVILKVFGRTVRKNQRARTFWNSPQVDERSTVL